MVIDDFLKMGFFSILIFVLLNNFVILPAFCINVETSEYGQNNNNINGNILFTPMDSTKTYLLNSNKEIIHIWTSNYLQAFAVHLLENGNLLRSDMPYDNPPFIAGGITGRVELFSWEGDIIWEFELINNLYCLHHDVEPLPNGNILMVAWEMRTQEDAIASGRDPNLVSANGMWPDRIIEIEPAFPSGGNIVWEWCAWDHLIQDYDRTKDNYGVVANHPELIDINYGKNLFNGDWLHINSIDYNEELDQILLSSRNFKEIWVIDHSTTTEEAKGHTGGNSSKGGDLLYRWGNPIVYCAGITSDQMLFEQHDARWIEPGCPGEGNILIFNNGVNRPGFDYTSVDEIVPPVGNNGIYYLEPGESYGPEEPIWSYTADNPTDFYANYVGGAQRLPSGNTLICDGPAGKFFEVTPEKVIVWEYVNPYPTPLLNDVFTIQYYPYEGNEEPDLDCEGSFQWIDIKGGGSVNGSFNVQNIGSSNSKLKWIIKDYPEWGVWSFYPGLGENLSPADGPVNIQVSIVAPDEKEKTFEGTITIESQENPDDYDVIPVILKTSRKITYNFLLEKFLNNNPNFFQLFERFLNN